MDLARLINEVAAERFKNDCINNQCIVHIGMHGGKYERVICVISLDNHVLLRYKTLEYKIMRSDEKTYAATVAFLLEEIENDIISCVHTDIEFDGYYPDRDDYYSDNYVIVKRNNERVFYRAFRENELVQVVGKYLYSLRFMN